MKLVIMILIFNHMIVIFVEFAPITIDENKFACVESNKISILVDHEKNDLCDSSIFDFIYDATEITMRNLCFYILQ